MSSTGTFVIWTKVSLLAVAACFIAALPDDNYLAGDLRVPSDDDDDYQLSEGVPDGALYSESRPKRAPWAPSLTRSEAYLRRVMELTGRRKSKRGPQQALQPFSQEDEPPFRDAIYLPEYLEQKHPQRRWANQERSDINKFTDPTVEVVSPEDFYGRFLEDPEPTNVDGNDDVQVEFVDRSREPKAKRVPQRLYIGFGQHAADAAIDAFEGILREGKNYRQERIPNPVRFLGRR